MLQKNEVNEASYAASSLAAVGHLGPTDESCRFLVTSHKWMYFKHCIYSLPIIFTSAKEVMFLPDFVCLSVCLCVSKITQKVMDGSF